MGTIDLVWCRDVLVHSPDLPRAYAEFRRVLRPGGRALVYQMFGTELLEPREAAWLCATMGVVPANADPARTEAATRAAGLRIDQCIVIGTEWGEWAQEHTGHGDRRLLHAARLRGDPGRYIDRFGHAAYDMMLGDCLWHVYALIGKLSRRIRPRSLRLRSAMDLACTCHRPRVNLPGDLIRTTATPQRLRSQLTS